MRPRKTHASNFIRGQVGAVYTLTVTNVGFSPTSGTVTVTDALPASLTATALSGPGWTCTQATLTCTRSDVLASGASYPDIMLTVTVALNAPTFVTNTVMVSGGGDVDPNNNVATDFTTVTGAFADVFDFNVFAPWIEALAHAGFTGGCATTPKLYCPDDQVTRGQVAVFLVRGIHGAGFDPPAATGTEFADVPATDPFARWIEQLKGEGITAGCATVPLRYCPDRVVTRAEIAVFVVRTFNLPM